MALGCFWFLFYIDFKMNKQMKIEIEKYFLALHRKKNTYSRIFLLYRLLKTYLVA